MATGAWIGAAGATHSEVAAAYEALAQAAEDGCRLVPAEPANGTRQ